MVNARVKDYQNDPEYERRMVAFCDVLGWRSQIKRAGSDSKKIGTLRRQILLVQRTIGAIKGDLGLRFSSFSDNIVLSGPPNALTLAAFKVILSDYQWCSAAFGFLTRGAVTMGDICHDGQVVFGPALNRAYELESQVAKYPRIIFDNAVFRSSKPKKEKSMMDVDNECSFLDPFTIEAIKISEELGAPDREYWDRIGLPTLRDGPNSIYQSLENCLEGIKPILRSPLTDKDYERVTWLYDRIANELGLPPSKSYPRVMFDSE
jgi:hypothetical protein